MTPSMANQRKAGIERVTLTLPDELLRAAEAEAAKQGIDRLALLRQALSSYLGAASAPARPEPTGPKAATAKKAARKKTGA